MARRPITWQNVAAPDHSDVSRMQYLSGQNFKDALTGAENAVKTLQTHEDDVLKRNAEDFKSRLLGQYTTSEQLQAAQASGAIQSLRDRYSDNGGLNTGMTDRGAVNTLIKEAQNLNTQNQLYADKQLAVSERPHKAALARLLADDKNTEARRILDDRYHKGEISTDTYTAGIASVGEATLADETRWDAERLARTERLYKEGKVAEANELAKGLKPASRLAVQQIQQEATIKHEDSNVISKFIGKAQKVREVNQQLLRNQQQFVIDTDVDILNPESLTPKQFQKAREFVASQAEQLMKKPETAHLYQDIYKEYTNLGYNADEARTRTDFAMSKVLAGSGISESVKAQQQKEVDAVYNKYSSNSLAKEFANNSSFETIEDLVGQERYAEITKGGLGEAQIRSLNMLQGYLKNGGVIPPNTIGNNEPIPLTAKTAKFVLTNMMNQKRGLDNWWLDMDINKALEDFYNANGMNAKERKEFYQMQNEIQAVKHKHAVANTPGAFIVTELGDILTKEANGANGTGEANQQGSSMADETVSAESAVAKLFNGNMTGEALTSKQAEQNVENRKKELMVLDREAKEQTLKNAQAETQAVVPLNDESLGSTVLSSFLKNSPELLQAVQQKWKPGERVSAEAREMREIHGLINQIGDLKDKITNTSAKNINSVQGMRSIQLQQNSLKSKLEALHTFTRRHRRLYAILQDQGILNTNM